MWLVVLLRLPNHAIYLGGREIEVFTPGILVSGDCYFKGLGWAWAKKVIETAHDFKDFRVILAVFFNGAQSSQK